MHSNLHFPLPERPRLRHVQLIPAEAEAERVFIAHDPQNYTEPVIIPEALGLFLLFCDGHHTVENMQQAIRFQAGITIPQERIIQILEMFDSFLLFDSARFQQFQSKVDAEFIASPVRPCAHAGASYPADMQALRLRLDEILAGGPPVEARTDSRLVGVISPHIDLRVGGAVYAPAYRILGESLAHLEDDPTAELTFIILGTSHYGGNGLFVASRKAYETPFGQLQCDVAFLEHLERQLGHSISQDDTSHRHEHSIEFQVIFLQHLFPQAVAQGRVRMVPILCTSFQMLLNESDVAGNPDRGEYQDFVKALRATLHAHTQSSCLLVGGDLAHIGRKFGDPFDAEEKLEAVAQADSALLSVVEQRDAQALLTHIAQDQDARNVCGFPPMLTFLDALDVFGDCEGEVLHYEQWHEVERASAVTYASLAFWQVSGADNGAQ